MPLPDGLQERRRRAVVQARVLAALTVISAVISAFCLVLAFQVSLRTLSNASTNIGLMPDECNEGDVPSTCPAGEFCQGGVCTSPGAPTRCEPGALCDACSCESPLTCDPRNVCTLPRVDGICGEGDVLNFLRMLQQKCGDARKCESKDLDKHAVSYPDFLELLGRFPNTLAIHFPDGQPGLSADDPPWPSATQGAHYVNRIRLALTDLEKADRILFVGLASKERRARDSEANKAITLKRLIAAQDLIRDAAKSALGAAKADALEAKSSIIHVGDRRSVNARVYGSQYGNRSLAWDASAEAQLLYLVEQGDTLGTPEELRWRDRTLNQVVFVVPIPCKPEGGP